MPRLKSISIENYRSIGENPVVIKFPDKSPVMLIGENNCGKSNVTKAIELIFGEFHPKYKKLEDFEHHQRDPTNRITIKAEVTGFQNRLGRSGEFSCGGFIYSSVKNHESTFQAIQAEDGQLNQYVSTQLRDELLCVLVSAEQNLSYQLSYASKYTLLSKVTKAFHDKLIEDQDKVDDLKLLFEQTKEIFLSVDEFRGFTESMSLISGEMLSNMTHALQFDFSAYDPSNYFRTLRVQAAEQKNMRSIEELGTGQQQILALSFAHAYAKCFLGQGLIFILDEPESHLHPLAQRWLAKQITKMATDGLQIVITTHSPHFINVEFLEGIYLTRKAEQTWVKNLSKNELANYCKETGATRADPETIIPYYSAHSTAHILTGFFANKIMLVEGLTEEISLPIYLDATGLDTLRAGIAIIGVGGKGNLAKWWRFFTAYNIPTYMCFDNDSSDDNSGTKRKDALKTIGVSSKGTEQLIASSEWEIAEQVCVFGKDFETTMRSNFSEYKTFEAEEIKNLGDSKPIVAKRIAQRIVQGNFKNQEGWKNLLKLSVVLKGLK